MVRFHKNGIMLLKNKQGKIYVFERDSTLAEVAQYLWSHENFSDFYISPDEKADKKHEIHYIDLKKELSPRLRNFDHIIDDTFYKEEA